VGAIVSSFVYYDEGRGTGPSGIGAKTLTWDQKSRAKQIVSAGGTLIFTYDPMNYRIGRSGGVLGNRAYYLEGEHLEAEYSGANLQAKYFRGLSTDELVAGYAYDSTGKWLPAIYHHDSLMSVTGISAHDGATVQTASYSAFGDRAVAGSGASSNRLKYTGRELDQDTGLYYYRARYYDPSIGRFISEDPLGFAAGINFYAYVGNNPVNANDPSGLGPESIVKMVITLTEKGVEGVGKLIARRGWRISEREAVENAATKGSNGGFVCPGCGKEVVEYDINHVKKWGETQREILNRLDNGETVTRAEVRDMYGKDIELKCVGCNRADNRLPAAAGGAAAAGGPGQGNSSTNGILGTGVTWKDVGEFLLDILVSPGTAEAPEFNPQPRTYDPSTVYGPLSSWSGYVNGAGGFVIYPNKTNTNLLRSVYAK